MPSGKSSALVTVQSVNFRQIPPALARRGLEIVRLRALLLGAEVVSRRAPLRHRIITVAKSLRGQAGVLVGHDTPAPEETREVPLTCSAARAAANASADPSAAPAIPTNPKVCAGSAVFAAAASPKVRAGPAVRAAKLPAAPAAVPAASTRALLERLVALGETHLQVLRRVEAAVEDMLASFRVLVSLLYPLFFEVC